MRPEHLRVAIVADLAEERWPSMDLVADMLTTHLQAAGSKDGRFDVRMLRPSLARVAHGRFSPARTIDRFVNRFWDYPRWLRSHASGFDIFHVVDHSYAHLVHVLPAEKTVVTCHDADAFLPLVDPTLTRSKLPRALTNRILTGLQKAAWVVCVTAATRDDLRRYSLVAPDRLTVVHNGVHPSFSAERNPSADAAIEALVGAGPDAHVDLLHVGTGIPRKRIDLLLRIVAAVREVDPRVRLLKAGGAFNGSQQEMVRALGLEPHVVHLPFLEPDHLAALYRRAVAVLLPSAREGFGLPVIEALACGTPVVATDLPVFREVGGSAATYCPLGDIPAWRGAVLDVVRRQSDAVASRKLRAVGLDQAAGFSWATCAASMARIYDAIAPAGRAAEAVRLAPPA